MSKSSMIMADEGAPAGASLLSGLPPEHPGAVLAGELEEIGVSASALARALDVPANRVTEILHGRRAITADTALRLAHYFGTSAAFWMTLQQRYDREHRRPRHRPRSQALCGVRGMGKAAARVSG